ncbi:probable glucan endo-1,3-beta-glucosidase A6 [Cornus florida]|uniref:probable glucan endo-1,3-beta-glucosidase A6 n=1 Tax=Cornus florida TaxID=4283 RepID=UPI0028A16CE2|nr:probable glucan endo-1,3-beta-glucosidase A6 [Cornus florida]
MCCFALILSSLLALSYAASSSRMGVNYGRLGDNLPSPYQSIQLLKTMKAGGIKLYDANPEILRLLSGTKLCVSVMVTNEQISNIASSQALADQWVHDNVLPYYPNTKIRSILVGNEVLSYNSESDRQKWHDLVPAMEKIEKAVTAHNIWNIKVGTPLAMDIMEGTFPPSNGVFRWDVTELVIAPLLHFLNRTNSFFFIDVYPYFPWSADPSNINLDFALLNAGNLTYTDPGTGLTYTNLLDQMLDSVVFAMAKMGYDNMRIAIAETGWPNGGDIDQPGANMYNAATYNRNLVRKMTATPPIGTPARPGSVTPTFIFALYDENQKSGPGTERHWGLVQPNGRANYELDLTGKRSESDYLRDPEPEKLWCVPGSGADVVELQSALDFACGQGNGTCDAIKPGKECYEPLSVMAHAGYAFSSYWAKFRSIGASCHFNGLAVQTTTDPSHGSCKLPSVTP